MHEFLTSIGPQFLIYCMRFKTAIYGIWRMLHFVNDFDMMNHLMIVEVERKEKEQALHYEVEVKFQYETFVMEIHVLLWSLLRF